MNMNGTRRTLVKMAGIWPVSALAGQSAAVTGIEAGADRLVLSDFTPAEEYVLPGARWRGFTDRVMGGVSNADFNRDEVAGKRCVRMTGNVTRDNGGGFVQMALYLNGADLSNYRGLELLVHGNDEDYNAHIRTVDCGWHDGVTVGLNTAEVERIGLLGWMRDFTADLAIAEIALYG
jgi:hypothetical protein